MPWQYIERERERTEGDRMKRIVWLLLVLFLLGGCAATYMHPTKSTADFDRDQKECEQAARKTLVAKNIPVT